MCIVSIVLSHCFLSPSIISFMLLYMLFILLSVIVYNMSNFRMRTKKYDNFQLFVIFGFKQKNGAFYAFYYV